MLIQTGNLSNHSLLGKVAIVTGGGGGIGYEAARALLWLGSKVVIAEANPKAGKQAAQRLSQEFGSQAVLFVRTNVGDASSVGNLARQVKKNYGQADIVLNNATIAPLGAVKDVDVKAWDYSCMSPRYWWLRSPNVGNSNNSRNVNTTGNVNNNNANNSNGVSPDCL